MKSIIVVLVTAAIASVVADDKEDFCTEITKVGPALCDMTGPARPLTCRWCSSANPFIVPKPPSNVVKTPKTKFDQPVMILHNTYSI